MKKLTTIIVLLLAISCGKETTTSRTQNTGLPYQQPYEMGSWMQVEIHIPNPYVIGQARSIKNPNYPDKSFLIGSQTPQQFKDVIYQLPEGIHNRRIQGQIGRETGNFPNPTAEVDVIHISAIE